MRRPLAISLVVALLSCAGAVLVPCSAQTPTAPDLKPTFLHPVPGLYVNGWPAFTVSYPKEWVDVVPTSLPGSGVFMVMHGDRFVLDINVFPNPLPLEDWATFVMPFWLTIFTDVKILSDKPSQLKDGNPAREVILEVIPKLNPRQERVENPSKHAALMLLTKRDTDAWVTLWVDDARGSIGEDLKKVAYSLTFQPEREKPVDVPPTSGCFST